MSKEIEIKVKKGGYVYLGTAAKDMLDAEETLTIVTSMVGPKINKSEALVIIEHLKNEFKI